MSDTFNLLDVTSLSREPENEARARRDKLEAPVERGTLRKPRQAAFKYQASERLRVAINTALALEMPLLVAGEPGTGKTQVGWFLAAAFGLEDPLVFPVRSTSTAKDLLYTFDSVGDFRDAQSQEGSNRARHVKPGPLWRALVSKAPQVILVDEVDKAPRDFPNDLLDVLDRFSFSVPELARATKDEVQAQFPGLKEKGGRWVVQGDESRRAPIVVLTTNSERRLPEPFLRRCIFHCIVFDKYLLERAVAARRDSDFGNLSEETEGLAIQTMMRLRAHQPPLRKKPSTAEFLGWLSLIARHSDQWAALDGPFSDLPFLEVLVKSQEDLETLGVKTR